MALWLVCLGISTYSCPKHLAGQWLNSYYKSILTKESRQEGEMYGSGNWVTFGAILLFWLGTRHRKKRFMPTMKMTAKSTQPPQL